MIDVIAGRNKLGSINLTDVIIFKHMGRAGKLRAHDCLRKNLIYRKCVRGNLRCVNENDVQANQYYCNVITK